MKMHRTSCCAQLQDLPWLFLVAHSAVPLDHTKTHLGSFQWHGFWSYICLQLKLPNSKFAQKAAQQSTKCRVSSGGHWTTCFTNQYTTCWFLYTKQKFPSPGLQLKCCHRCEIGQMTPLLCHCFHSRQWHSCSHVRQYIPTPSLLCKRMNCRTLAMQKYNEGSYIWGLAHGGMQWVHCRIASNLVTKQKCQETHM